MLWYGTIRTMLVVAAQPSNNLCFDRPLEANVSKKSEMCEHRSVVDRQLPYLTNHPPTSPVSTLRYWCVPPTYLPYPTRRMTRLAKLCSIVFITF